MEHPAGGTLLACIQRINELEGRSGSDFDEDGSSECCSTSSSATAPSASESSSPTDQDNKLPVFASDPSDAAAPTHDNTPTTVLAEASTHSDFPLQNDEEAAKLTMPSEMPRPTVSDRLAVLRAERATGESKSPRPTVSDRLAALRAERAAEESVRARGTSLPAANSPDAFLLSKVQPFVKAAVEAVCHTFNKRYATVEARVHVLEAKVKTLGAALDGERAARVAAEAKACEARSLAEGGRDHAASHSQEEPKSPRMRLYVHTHVMCHGDGVYNTGDDDEELIARLNAVNLFVKCPDYSEPEIIASQFWEFYDLLVHLLWSYPEFAAPDGAIRDRVEFEVEADPPSSRWEEHGPRRRPIRKVFRKFRCNLRCR